jgi:hypothetical protein
LCSQSRARASSAPDSKFREAGGRHHLADRTPEDEFAASRFYGDLPERRRAYKDELIGYENTTEYAPGQFRRTAFQPKKGFNQCGKLRLGLI